MSDSLCSILTACRQGLTQAGAPFEVVEQTLNGQRLRSYKHAPQTLVQLLEGGRGHGDKTFLVYGDQRWSFQRYFQEVDALTEQLVTRFGVGKGDRVAIAMRNRPEWPVAFLAAIHAGAIAVPLNSWGRREELLHGLVDSTPKVLICDPPRLSHVQADAAKLGVKVIVTDQAPGAADGDVSGYDALIAAAQGRGPVDIAPEDPALILYTSGTTSKPKGVLSSHRALCQGMFNIDCQGAVTGMTTPDVVQAMMQSGFAPSALLGVPLFHISGLHAHFLSALRGGRKLVMLYKWDVQEVLSLIARERVTQVAGAPAQMRQLLGSDGFDATDTSSLFALGLGGSGASTYLLDMMLAKKPDSLAGTGYGATETNGVAASTAGAAFRYKPASAGMTSPIAEVRIANAHDQPLAAGEIGEIQVRTAAMMDGYWGAPEATAEALVDGWYRSGDLGYLDDEGFLFVVGRSKDVIIRGGENISAAEVEACVHSYPGVQEAAAFSVPHELLEEEVAVAVIASPGVELDPAALQAHVALHLAAYKVPSHVIQYRGELPRNAAGKVLKQALRQAWQQQQKTAGGA